MRRKRRFRLPLLIAVLALVLSLGSWVWWGGWPGPASYGEVTDPAIMVVLGGGDGARAREALRLAAELADVPILVTGDSGFVVQTLLASGIPVSRIAIEHDATSTWENAVLSKPWVDEAGNGQLVLVTNDFHAPRSHEVFRKIYPKRQIVVACQPTTAPYNQWQQTCRRRERAAAIYYTFRYGVWSF